MDLSRVGDKVRTLRLTHGLTQEALAEKAELSASYLSCIERGTKKASLESLLRIAVSLDTTVDHVLADVHHMDTKNFVPEVCELLQDCSASECYVIFETSRAVKQALRNHMEH